MTKAQRAELLRDRFKTRFPAKIVPPTKSAKRFKWWLITDHDRVELLDFAHRVACVRAGIDPLVLVTTDEMTAAIKLRAPSIAVALEGFANSYNAWHAFHRRVDADGRQGALGSSETMELIALSDAKDAARLALRRVLGLA